LVCRRGKERRRQRGRGQLERYKWRALEGTAGLNPGLDLDQLHAPVLKLGCGGKVSISNSTGQHRLFWKCSGCDSDVQHYRLCTAKTLKSAEDLGCSFCPVRPRGQLVLPASNTVWHSEGRFMQLLWSWGLHAEYCHQAVPPFWAWPVDFYNYVAGFWVLVDGRHHWIGIHQYTKADIADKDMRLNLAAIEAGRTVLRVHAADLKNPSCVLAALVAARAAAKAGAAIVLTPSFANCWAEWQGRKELYVDMLQHPHEARQRRLRMVTAEQGICVFTPL